MQYFVSNYDIVIALQDMDKNNLRFSKVKGLKQIQNETITALISSLQLPLPIDF